MRDMAQLRLQVGDAGSSLKTHRVVAGMSEPGKGELSAPVPHRGSKSILHRSNCRISQVGRAPIRIMESRSLLLTGLLKTKLNAQECCPGTP